MAKALYSTVLARFGIATDARTDRHTAECDAKSSAVIGPFRTDIDAKYEKRRPITIGHSELQLYFSLLAN